MKNKQTVLLCGATGFIEEILQKTCQKIKDIKSYVHIIILNLLN